MKKSELLKLIGEILSEDYMDEPSRDFDLGATSKKSDYTYVYKANKGSDTCVFMKDKSGKLWVYNAAFVGDKELDPYKEKEVLYRGKTADDTVHKDNYNDTMETWENYINDNADDTGHGLNDYEDGVTFVTVDKPLADYLLNDVFKGEKGMLHRVLEPILKENNNKLKNIIKEEIRSILKETRNKK